MIRRVVSIVIDQQREVSVRKALRSLVISCTNRPLFFWRADLGI